MRRFIPAGAAILLVVLMTGCKPSVNSDSEAKSLQAVEAQWEQDFAAKDFDKALAHYTDDAVMMVPGAPPVVGKPAIEAAFKPLRSDPDFKITFHSDRVVVSSSGDLAYTQGAYTTAMTDQKTGQVVHDHGSYITTFRRQTDGSWKASSDISDSEVARPQP